MNSTIIQLQVGEKRFLTSRAKLVDAKFFNSLLSGRWASNRQPNGSYFINADANLFEHILRYHGYLNAGTTSYTSGEDYIECHHFSVKERVYICPRGIGVHMGREDRCGRDCEKKRAPSGPQYEERDVTKTISVRKKTVINGEALLDGWDDDKMNAQRKE
ncbi:hypothetical protein B0J14DRAFT_630563 [Halenospora varia]|nr:hypothetical protein B0J14DRAFT_630563 [Halenospora varia]